MTETKPTPTAYPILDTQGLKLIFEPRRPITLTRTNRDSGVFEWFSPTGVGWNGDPSRFSPYQRGSEVTAPCIDCGGAGKERIPDKVKKPLFRFVINCPRCQDGLALYRVTGEVELKQAKGISFTRLEIAGSWYKWQKQNEIGGESWLCVARAERLAAEVTG